jgi:sugar phosphate permease
MADCLQSERLAPAGDASRSVWLSGALLLVAQSSQILIFGGISLFLPLIRKDAHLSFSQAGVIVAISTGVYAVMQIPAGHMADRFDPKRLYVGGLILVNILGFTFARLESFTEMAANQVLSGFFRSLVFAPGLILMMSHFPERRRSTAMGVYVAGGVSSNIFLSALGPFLVTPLGWRALFEILSIAGVLVTLAYLRWGRPAPQRFGTPPSLRSVLGLFRIRAMWLVGGIQYIRLAVAYGLSAWLPTYVVVGRGYSLEIAGLVVAVSVATTVPANIAGGYIGDRLKDETKIILIALAGLAISLVVLVQVDDLALLLGVAAVQGIFVQVYFGPLFGIPVKVLAPGRAGSAAGFGNFFANVGGFTFAFTIGVVKDATGSFAAGFYCLSGLCVVGLVLTAALSRAIRTSSTGS